MKKINLISISLLMALSINAQQYNIDSCKHITLKNSRKIRNAELKHQELQQIKKEAASKYFPKVTAGGFAMKADDYLFKAEIPQANLPVYDGNPVNLQNPTQFAFFPGMEINMLDYLNVAYVAAVEPVYMGGRVRNGNHLAKLGTEVSQMEVELSTDQSLMKTEQHFWTLISLKGRISTIDAYDSLLSQLYKDVEVSYEAGLIEKTDLLKVKMKKEEVKLNRLKLENAISLVSRALCNNMGIDYSADIEFIANSDTLTPRKLQIVNSGIAVERRQEYKMLLKAIEIENLQKKMAIGEVLPQFSVGAQAYYLDMMNDQNSNAILFASLNIPISDWWGGSHKIKQHSLKVEMAENNLSDNKELIILQIEKAKNELYESLKQYEYAMSFHDESTEYLGVSDDNYCAGLVSVADLLEAQALLSKASDGLVDAKCNYQIKLANYNLVVGEAN